MGNILQNLGNLHHPFHTVEEWIVSIPAGQFIKATDPSFHLVFVLDGEYLLEIPDHPVMHLTKGDAHSLSFETPCTLRAPSSVNETRIHLLRLDFCWPSARDVPRRKLSGRPEKQFEATLRERLSGFRHFPHILFDEYYPMIRSILSEMEKRDEASAWKISGLCQALTAGLLAASPVIDNPSEKIPRHHRQKSVIIQRALQYLQENCHEALTLDTIAWKVQLSGEHLARLFKQETGRTVFTWLHHFRTEKARDLLTITEWSLSQIAHACGYATPKLLSRHFKKNIGYPPIVYRTKIQKGEIFSPSKLAPITEAPQNPHRKQSRKHL